MNFPTAQVLGLHVLLSDDYHKGFETNAEWEPRLYEYQQKAANVLIFTFIHPQKMEVPKSFQNLAKTRGLPIDGAVPANTVIIFSIGNKTLAYIYNATISLMMLRN